MRKVQLTLILLRLFMGLVQALDICENQFDNVTLLHPADCNKFVVCENGKTSQIVNCPIGMHFNRFKGICDSREHAACDMDFISERSASENCVECCALYGCLISPPTPGNGSDTGCGNGNANEPTTPKTPVTSATSQTPVYPETPGNSVEPETPTTSQPANKCSNGLIACLGKPDGSVAHVNGTCNQYIVCVAQCAIIMDCPNNLQYNLESNICDYPENVNCPWQSTPPITGPSGVTCAQPGKCLGKADGTLYADPNGDGYIVCQCECEIKRPCSSGTKFDEKLKTCSHSNTNGSVSGNGSGSGSDNGSGNGSGNGNGNESGSGSGNGSSSENGNETGSGSGNGSSSENGNETGSGSGNGSSSENGNETGSGSGNESGSENGNESGSGSGNESGSENGNESGSGSGNGSSNANETIIACPNNVQLCKDQEEGTLFPVDGICNKFYKCNYGCAIEISCPNNLVYNPTQEYCDYPQNYKCPWPYTPPAGPTAGPSGIACPSGGRCVGQEEGTLFPSLNSCSKYVVCQCECEVEMECAKGLLWDTKLSICNYAESVTCNLV
ncbi:uncharacterized protein ACRADG_002342 [Cochliomyia hominivorax]